AVAVVEGAETVKVRPVEASFFGQSIFAFSGNPDRHGSAPAEKISALRIPHTSTDSALSVASVGFYVAHIFFLARVSECRRHIAEPGFARVGRPKLQQGNNGIRLSRFEANAVFGEGHTIALIGITKKFVRPPSIIGTMDQAGHMQF